MKPIFAICLVPVVAWTMEAHESAPGWTNLGVGRQSAHPGPGTTPLPRKPSAKR